MLRSLEHFPNFSIRYLPRLSNGLLLLNCDKIKSEMTMIGGQKVVENNEAPKKPEKVLVESEIKIKNVCWCISVRSH